ncbi:exonuclease SbcCD subunit D [Candidatus Aquicultor secundus]|nr:exonuclease SbcCD subunit D [Candidatus Aquicultor secundus]NCO66833.1 exonuclease SbcCD subunit D [Solirubrobacter sp.]
MTKSSSTKQQAHGIKVIHFADLHLGVENYGRVDSKTGLNQRVIDFLKSLNFLVSFAIENNVALVVFAGDAFRNQKPNPTLQREFARAIRRLTKEDIKVVLLVGNHDLPNMDKQAHSMAVYNALETDNVIVASLAELLTIETKQGAVQVATIPHFSRSQLVAKLKEDDVESKNKTLTELNELITQKIERFVSILAADIDQTLPAILTAHVSISSAKVGNEERSILAGNEVTLLSSVLQRPEFDYIALGHIHKFQDLSRGAYPHLVYSGSIDRVDFGEEKEDKGFCLINLVRGATTYEFVKTPARRFVTLDIECKSDDPTAEICSLCEKHDLGDCVVRVRVKVPAKLKEQVRKDEIVEALSGAYFIAYIAVEATGEETRTRNPHLTESQTPAKALTEYIKTRDDLLERQAELTEYGQKLIDELMQRKA